MPRNVRSHSAKLDLSHIKGIIFDLDNTLYVYENAHIAGARASHKKYPVKYPFSQFFSRYHAALSENEKALHGTGSSHNRLLYFQRMLETDGCFSPQRALLLYKTYWTAFIGSMKLEKNLRDILLRLVRRYKLGILSDLTADVQFAKLTAHRLWPFFDALVTSEEAGAEKPSTRGLRLLLQKMKLRSTQVVFVGDNPYADGLCAASLGIPYIQIVRKDMRGTRGGAAWRKIKNLQELLRVLRA